MKNPVGKDKNFICRCGGDILLVKTLENGRKVFACSEYLNGKDRDHQKLFECVICHLPKTIWADDGTICDGCGLKFLEGELALIEEQKAGIRKWMIKTTICIKAPL